VKKPNNKEKKERKKKEKKKMIKQPVLQQNEIDSYMKKFYIFFPNRRFYGYDPEARTGDYSSHGLKLRQFSRDEVKEIVKKVFKPENVLFDESITAQTNLLIVPDHWDHMLPVSARQYRKDVKYLPFSHVLHASVSGSNNVQSLIPPVDADFRVLLEERKPEKSEMYISLDKIPKDTSIIQNFLNRGMETQHVLAAPTSTMTHSIKKHKKKPLLAAHADTMAEADMELKTSAAKHQQEVTAARVKASQKLAQVQLEAQMKAAKIEEEARKKAAKSAVDNAKIAKKALLKRENAVHEATKQSLKASTKTMGAPASVKPSPYWSDDEDDDDDVFLHRANTDTMQPTDKEYEEAWQKLLAAAHKSQGKNVK
jgi:hypothetical protein